METESVTDDEALRLGEEAQLLLENELLKAMLASVVQGAVDAWKQAQTVEARELAHATLRGANAFVAELKGTAARGRHVANVLKDRREAEAAAKRMDSRAAS